MPRLLYFFCMLTLVACQDVPTPRPNILLITSEDMTTLLGSYGDPNAHTPHLDAFARQSIQFTHAFATAPVCSPARSCIITGHQAVSLGTQHLRSEISIPEEIRPFPKYLREAGYFTSNNAKEDYNFSDTTIWDISSSKAHWSERPENQPFFSVFNLNLTHQSGIFGDDSVYEARIRAFAPFVHRISPDSLQLPPYYPDTPEIRKMWARYYTNVGIIDYQFSQILQELEEDGLADNTLVFFFSDHGTGLPRGKRALYDSGLKIPLLVRIPPKYADRFDFSPGTKEGSMVSFLDFAPTVLQIAGVALPQRLRGKAFVTESPVQERAYVYGTSDRVDEGYEMSRTIRTQDYRYIRNFMPHLPLLQPNFYTDQSRIMQELHRMRSFSNLSPAQLTMFATERPVEELYYLADDPHEVNNLVADPQYQEVLTNLRQKLEQELLEIHDTGLMPEPDMLRLSAGRTPYELAHDAQLYPLEEIMEACSMMLEASPATKNVLSKLNHPNGFVRYWTIVTIQKKDIRDPAVLERLEALQQDAWATVQIEASKTLVKLGRPEAIHTIARHMQRGDDPLVLFASRAFQEVAERLPEIPQPAHSVYARLKNDTQAGEARSDYYKLYAYWALSEVLSHP